MVQTYRKFDRVRGKGSFNTFEDSFETLATNRWIPGGTGTPVVGIGTNGGMTLATSAASGDSVNVQRGIETAATKLVSLPLRQGRKVCAVARVEHADFNNMDIGFGLAPALADPFAGNTSLFAMIGATTNTIKIGANAVTPDVAVTLQSLRDKLGGIDFEFYFDGQSKIALFAGGQRIGGVRNLTFDANKLVNGFANPLSISLGVVSRSASAKTVVVRKLGYSYQIKPDLGVAA